MPGNLCCDSTRAASSTAALPDPSSFAPGASAVAFITSLTRLSIWPEMMTTSLGRSVPRWMASTSVNLVGTGMRSRWTMVDGRAVDEALATFARVEGELGLAPRQRGADAVLRRSLRRQGMPRSEPDQRGDIGAEAKDYSPLRRSSEA